MGVVLILLAFLSFHVDRREDLIVGDFRRGRTRNNESKALAARRFWICVTTNAMGFDVGGKEN